MVRSTRPSPLVFAYCKRSKTGAGEGRGMRLLNNPILWYVAHLQEQLEAVYQGVVTYMLPVEAFATGIKIFDRQKVCLIT